MHTPLTALVTLLTVVLLIAVAVMVGRARGKYGVAAPATSGPEGFERAFRIQMNTLENAVAFLPALWIFALYLSDRWAALIGAVWWVARVWYAISYQRDPSTRGKAFGLGMLSLMVLLIGAFVGLLRNFNF